MASYMAICGLGTVVFFGIFSNIYPGLAMVFLTGCVFIAKKSQKIEIEGNSALITTFTGVIKINDIEAISCRFGVLTVTGKGNKRYELVMPNNEGLVRQFISENF